MQHDKFEFPCNGELVTLDDCFDCKDHENCDIYASLLDEAPDYQSD